VLNVVTTQIKFVSVASVLGDLQEMVKETKADFNLFLKGFQGLICIDFKGK
jgi:hypothetical protein